MTVSKKRRENPKNLIGIFDTGLIERFASSPSSARDKWGCKNIFLAKGVANLIHLIKAFDMFLKRTLGCDRVLSLHTNCQTLPLELKGYFVEIIATRCI